MKFLKLVSVVIALALSSNVNAAIITFDFTGRLVMTSSSGGVVWNGDQMYTPIAASLSYDTVTGLGNSSLSITMSDGFYGIPATMHDISMVRQAGTNFIDGQVLADWNDQTDMPLHVEWDATGLFNAIDFGLQAGDKLSGTNLFRDSNEDGIWEEGEWVANIGSTTPYSDTLPQIITRSQYDPEAIQGPAPMAATINSQGFGAATPFPGFVGYFDIGSGNSMYVTSVSAVPIPAAAWLFGSGLIGLAGFARCKKA